VKKGGSKTKTTMKKLVYLIAAVFITTLGFTGCGDSDEPFDPNKPGGNFNLSLLFGSWETRGTYDEGGEFSHLWTFNKDGSFELIEHDEYDEPNYGSYSVMSRKEYGAAAVIEMIEKAREEGLDISNFEYCLLISFADNGDGGDDDSYPIKSLTANKMELYDEGALTMGKATVYTKIR
jgi:hypothetical protein